MKAGRWDRILAVAVLALFAGQSASVLADKDRRRRKKKDKPAAEPVASEAGVEDTPVTPPKPAAPAGPWAEGVSAEQKAEAQGHLERGNAQFLESSYQEALDSYNQAIAAWDHPAIRFNMVRVLINLDRGLEAYENLELALKYGEAPLEPQVYAEAKTTEKLLLGQLAEIEVTCKEPGAVISLDARPLLTCPGTVRQRVESGPHNIVAKKPAFLTEAREENLFPGKLAKVDIKLVPLAEAAVTSRRWASWKPWAVVGGGAFIAGMGGLLQLKASRDFDSFDSEVDQECSNTGCPESGPGALPQSTLDLESRAKLENKIAVGMMTVGTATVAGGLLLLWMNRAKTFTPTEESGGAQPSQAIPPVTLLPSVGADQVSVDLALRF